LKAIINPFNVIRLLLTSINSIYLTKIEAEIELKEGIQKLLLDSISHYRLEVTEETISIIKKLHNSEIIEDIEESWRR